VGLHDWFLDYFIPFIARWFSIAWVYNVLSVHQLLAFGFYFWADMLDAAMNVHVERSLCVNIGFHFSWVYTWE
jgi:hypothetical protein